MLLLLFYLSGNHLERARRKILFHICSSCAVSMDVKNMFQMKIFLVAKQRFGLPKDNKLNNCGKGVYSIIFITECFQSS